MSLTGFVWPVRVYYEDTDSGGVVYYANYLKFMERARTEYLRSAGFEQDQLRRDDNLLFAVHSIQVDYRQSAVFNDLLEVTAEIREQRRASLVFFQQVLRATESAPLCTGHIRIACVDADSFRPRPVPESIISSLVNVN